MRQFLLWFGGGVVILGVVLAAAVWQWPSSFDMSDASAIQMTQVYTMAAFYMLAALAVLVTGAALLVASVAARDDDARGGEGE